jgi:hypothetical protein
MSGGRRWEAGDVAALIVNPFYAIQLHPSLARAHEHLLTEADWIAAGERAIEELGATLWLEHLLTALKADHHPAREPQERLAIADPYLAITVDRTLCEEHPPLVDEATWVASNVHGIEEAAGPWLQNLLSVLKGVYVSSPAEPPR